MWKATGRGFSNLIPSIYRYFYRTNLYFIYVSFRMHNVCTFLSKDICSISLKCNAKLCRYILMYGNICMFYLHISIHQMVNRTFNRMKYSIDSMYYICWMPVLNLLSIVVPLSAVYTQFCISNSVWNIFWTVF